MEILWWFLRLYFGVKNNLSQIKACDASALLGIIKSNPKKLYYTTIIESYYRTQVSFSFQTLIMKYILRTKKTDGEEGGSVGNLIKISKNIPTDAPLHHSVQCTTYYPCMMTRSCQTFQHALNIKNLPNDLKMPTTRGFIAHLMPMGIFISWLQK